MTEWGEGEPARIAVPDDDLRFVVDVGGFEGPLDLLLDLARRQKVDLHEISILALAEQYLAFVEAARALRLELAADYLVMAAWLAYLKSRLLLPEPPRAEGPSAGDLAAALAGRLRRLEAIRAAAHLLGERPQLGRDVFASGAVVSRAGACGEPAGLSATLHDLLAAYARQRRPGRDLAFVVARRRVWSLAEARVALERLLGERREPFDLQVELARFLDGPDLRATLVASFLSAALEMAREGEASLTQDRPFGPVRIGPSVAPGAGLPPEAGGQARAA